MSLSEKQRNRALEKVTKELLKKGVPPDVLRISEQFAKVIPDILGEPSFRFIQQPRRGNLRVDDQNKMFTQAADDLSLLYEENIDVLERYLSQLALLEIQGRRYGGEIRMIQKHLEDLLLTSERATNFFFGVGDTFIDLSQIDQARSDIAIDVGAGLITLAPDSRSKKIPLAHLLEEQTGLVSIREPATALGRLVPGSKFGNAFEDTLTAWQYQVLTPQQSPVEIDVVIPVVATGEAPVQVSRITLQGMSATPYSVLPLWARDGIAFAPFTGVEEPRFIVDEFATLEIPEQLVTHIMLRFRKNSPDGEEATTQNIQFKTLQDPTTTNTQGQLLPVVPPASQPTSVSGSTTQALRVFSTVFAFKNIGIWSMGYKRSGSLVTKVLTPQDSESLSTIGKVALTVDESVPNDSSIRYEIASNLEPEVFVPISPMNRPNVDGPQVVDFSTVQRSTRDDNNFTIDDSNPATSLGTIRGTEFFSIAGVGDAVVDKTARLWRGINAWTCLREEDVQIEQIRNLLIDFSDSDTQRLYVFEEEERIVEHGTNDGTSALKLRTRFPILLEGDQFNPAEDLRAPSDTAKPNFAIRKLIRRPAPGTINQAQVSGSTVSIKAATENAAVGVQSQPGSPTAGRAGAEITISNFSSAGLLATTAAGSIPDLFKSDFRISYTNNSKIITSVFTIESAQLLDGGNLILTVNDPTGLLETTTSAASVTWEVLSVNITPHITEVDGSELTLAEEQQIGSDDIIEISYRRGLLPSESPITSTAVVKSSTAGDTVFVEGTDYTINQGARTITRISTGNIQRATDDATLAALLDFDYENKKLNLITYKTHVFIPEPTPKLTLSKITVDRENGEEILLESNNGFLDLHDRDNLPSLSSGWHQIVVRSNPIHKDDGTVDTTSAIYKAISIKEIRTATDAGRFLMPAEQHPDAIGNFQNKFANYFTRQAALLTPMRQVPFRQLSTAVRKTDRSVFAIKPATETPATATAAVAINFDPQDLTKTDLLYFPPDLSGAGAQLDREDFALEYTYIPTGTDTITGVKLRATFSRDAIALGSVTPILYSYNIRLSF